jgi:hypothetical protein
MRGAAVATIVAGRIVYQRKEKHSVLSDQQSALV